MGETDPYITELLAVQRRLHTHLLTLVANFADAEDLLQETNAVLLRKRDEYQPGTNFGAWACQVAYFQVLAHRKQQGRHRHLFASPELLEQMASEVAGRFLTPEHDQLLANLDDCVSEIPLADQELLDMRYRINLSSQTMAERLGRTAAAVRRHLWRIRTGLLHCLERKDREMKSP